MNSEHARGTRRRQAASKGRRSMRMRRSVVLLAFLVALTGCGSAAQPPAKPHTTGPAMPISIRIVLPSRTVMAGSRLAGHVVVDNNTGHAIHSSGCGVLFTVALASSSYHPVAATPSCLQFFTIPAGTSRYRVQGLASYLAWQRAPCEWWPQGLPVQHGGSAASSRQLPRQALLPGQTIRPSAAPNPGPGDASSSSPLARAFREGASARTVDRDVAATG